MSYTFLAMPFLADETQARFLMTLYGGWFGGPVVVFRGKVVDGNKRLPAWRSLSFLGRPPQVESDKPREVARLLCAAHHYRRAGDVLGASVSYDADLPYLLRLPPELGTPLVALMGRRSAWEIRKDMNKHRAPRRTKKVVDDLRRLYISALEDGIVLTPEHLAQVLGTWR